MGFAGEDVLFGADFFLGADFLAFFAAFFLGAAFLFMPALRAVAFFFFTGRRAIFFLRGFAAFLFALFFAKLPPPFTRSLKREALH